MKRSFKEDYLSAAETLRSHYTFRPDASGLEAAMKARKRPALPGKALAAILRRQQQELPFSDAQQANLISLESEEALCLVTGQQPGMFGGPAYTVYKALSVIRMAADLRLRFPQRTFVPVFWMATEDHDAEEVSAFYRADGTATRYPGSISGAAGRHVIEPAVNDCFENGPYEKLRSYYQTGKTWSAAFREWYQHLLGDQGLLLLDGDDPELKRAFIPLAQKEIEEGWIRKATRGSDEILVEKGYELQLRIRDCNLFYLAPNARLRIDIAENSFSTADSQFNWSKEEILAELNQFPERFSPNAAMRPVYQETVLPGIAYAGGWGEIAYWLQLLPAFQAAGLDYPVLMPRFSAMVFQAAHAADLEACGLQMQDLKTDKQELINRLTARFWDESRLQNQSADLLAKFSPIFETVSAVDPTQAISLESEKVKLASWFANLEKKLKKSVRNRHPKPFQALERLYAWAWPGGEMQERRFNFAQIAAENEKEYIRLLSERCDPFTFETEWILMP